MLVESFIQNLAVTNPEINIIDFVKKLNEVTYNIDISFIEEFIDLVGRTDFCVPHTALFTYHILTDHDTSNVKRLLDQNEFEIDKYYKLTNLVEEGRDLRGKFVKTYIHINT